MCSRRILTVEQMLWCEARSAELGVSLGELMDNAAEQLARCIERACREQGCSEPVILVGKGNNGGDGLVAANLLAGQWLRPRVVLCCGEPSTELASRAFKGLRDDIPVTGADDSLELIRGAGVLVDCIFGTGFQGELRESMLGLFRAMEECEGHKIACDIPSGVNARNGQVSKGAFRADLTVTMHAMKLGMALSPGKYWCGETAVCDIGIPQAVNDGPKMEMDIRLEEEASDLTASLPERAPWGHKGTFGKLICLCGSRRYMGAAGLSVQAAMRTGVGLAELCTTPETSAALAGNMYECVYHPMEVDGEGFMAPGNVGKILELCRGADALLIGCGLGHTAGTEELVKGLVENTELPLIIDADGINSLVPNIDVLKKGRGRVVLTPHPGELARLCGVGAEDIAADRLGYARELVERYGITVAAKSAETLICGQGQVILSAFGNTALSKGGSGDMLAGIIGSLMAQGMGPVEACELGCCILGGTAELVSRGRSPRGILARDILRSIPVFLRSLE